MALALIANVKSRVIAILNANPGVWSSSVSGTVGAFPSDSEIDLAALQADEWVATQCYFQSVNASLSRPFKTTTAISNGDSVPFHHGNVSQVELSPNNSTWDQGVMAQSRDDIVQAAALETYFGTGAADFLYYLDPTDGHFYTTSPFARITYPIYTRTAALQCDANEEALIADKAVSLLMKHASPALFAEYDQKAERGRQHIIQDGVYTEGTD